MIVNQVLVELTLPPAAKGSFKGVEGLRATITYKPNEPGSTQIFLPSTDLNLEQLKVIGDFVNNLSLFGDRAKEIVDSIIIK